ncbi:MAG: dihydroneopterin aldolase [Candidatus Eremiobacteraeota bacterium]|nr:dihydroneopterin aldolase [Candidatus Eremiobacteraeota bacterium]
MSGEAHDRGIIRISGMRFWGKHGANAGERERQQPIDVDVEIQAELGQAWASDRLADSVDYSAVFRTCQDIVERESFALLEALADRIARGVCAEPRVTEVVVRVRKPRLLDGATPEVELRRRKA